MAEVEDHDRGRAVVGTGEVRSFICPRCAARSDASGPCAKDGAERLDCDADPLLGVKVGNYRLCAPIAGQVYRAVNGNTGGVAAVKVAATAGAEATAALRAEARAANLINHAAAVRCYDQGALPDGRAYVLMEALEGRTLAARLAEGPLAAGEIAAIRAVVRDALAAARAAGVAHGALGAETIVIGGGVIGGGVIGGGVVGGGVIGAGVIGAGVIGGGGAGVVKLLGLGAGGARLDPQALDRVLAEPRSPSAFEPPARTVALPTQPMTLPRAPLWPRRERSRPRLAVVVVLVVAVLSISTLAGWLLGG